MKNNVFDTCIPWSEKIQMDDLGATMPFIEKLYFYCALKRALVMDLRKFCEKQ